MEKKSQKKYVYYFGDGKADGNGTMKDLLGGKGAGLAEMTNAGVPVPSGFTITTETCIAFYQEGMKIPAGLNEQMLTSLHRLEESMGAKLGDVENPLLVSVRSGAKFSMPGMMDTILNLGLNDETVKGLAKKTGNERFAYDCYRRFIQMFGNVVMGLDKGLFEEVLDAKKKEKRAERDTDLTAQDLKDLAATFKQIVAERTGHPFPQNAFDQLSMARDAVFKSWNNPRAITYRKLNKIADDLGTAVNVQAMVFGNMGEDSATGVGFTRNPANGEKEFYGEFLTNAQGEDVVAGIRTPHPIRDLQKIMPEVFQELRTITDRLEKHYRDVQDFEFTIQQKKLYMLQTRTGKRTAQAALKIAVDMVKEGLINKEEAVLRIDPAQLDQLLHRRIDPKARLNVIAKGLGASPGAAAGKVVFNADEAVELSKQGVSVILVREETNPDDIHGMAMAQGILTARGGATSHAAVVARGMGKCCVVGCEAIHVMEGEKKFMVGELEVRMGDEISLDGSNGSVILGVVPMIDPEPSPDFLELMQWADTFRRMRVRTNADTPHDAEVAKGFGAEGIGLCRTEHMFFSEERIPIVQEMILASTKEARLKALEKLLPMQRSDFKGIFEVMDGLAVTIRLLDPPLHEFLPDRDGLLAEISLLKARGERQAVIVRKEEILKRLESLRELNPMLGHRGCRLGITYPEITEMQVRAIFQAACEVTKAGKKVSPEVMVPLVGDLNEFEHQRNIIIAIAEQVIQEAGVAIDYKVGTMIELPRAAVTAGRIAAKADFFSFGTNDLTQTTFGFSRDDVVKFIGEYVDKKILPRDPFVSLDVEGVGYLIRVACEQGRATKSNLKVGVCGEHGGDPDSAQFFENMNLDYVSCSPFRVPIARLASAQAALQKKGGTTYTTK